MGNPAVFVGTTRARVVIIGLAGISKSGKSYLAQKLQETLQWPVLSFGSYVRAEARRRGLSDDFDSLQTLGQSLVDENAEAFLTSVLEHADVKPDSDLIVDGIRHVEVLDVMRQIAAPEPIALVLVSVDHDILEARHRAIGQEIAGVLEGVAEQQVQTALADVADILVSGVEPVDDAVSTVLEKIEKLRGQ